MDDGNYREKYKEFEIVIENDMDVEDPRHDGTLGKMICFHRRYDLGDKTDLKSDMFNGWDEWYDYIKKDLKGIIILPLYLLDHSNIWMRVGRGFGDVDPGHWDSGQVGFIYTTKEAILKECSVKKIGKRALKKAEDILCSEVDVYSKYISGECFAYRWETGGCGGYFGDDGIAQAIEDAKVEIDIYVKEKIEKHCKKVKAYIRNKVPVERREALSIGG